MAKLSKTKSDSASGDPKVLKIADLPRTLSEGFRSLYTNNANVAASQFDIRITFSETVVGPSGGTINDLVSVVMSPQHAKRLAKVFRERIEAWEKEFGTIRYEPEKKTRKRSTK